MEIDLLIPLFWMVIFGGLITLGVRRLSKKLPTKKKWVRPDKAEEERND